MGQNRLMPKHWDCIIVGAGAAGLMCALKVGQSGKRVLLVEQNPKPGMKILISGGGRCNFTNKVVSNENYRASNTHFSKSALNGFSPQQFIQLIEGANIEYYEKTLGQLFCKKSSKLVVQMLLDHCLKNGVEILYNCKVDSIKKVESEFYMFSAAQEFIAKSIVLATGGMSFPKLGGNGSGYKLAKNMGHKLIEPKPALVPLTFTGEELELYQSLSGVSVETVVSCGKAQFREMTLFTHRGLSGPAILQASLYWEGRPQPIFINWLPDCDILELLISARLNQPKQTLFSILRESLPKSFLESWIKRFFPEALSVEVANLNKRQMALIGEKINGYKCFPSGTEGYAKAEVTMGGINCKEVSSKTFESNICSGLYLIGEILDVTGWLGGYNFQWAWASAHAASEAVKQKLTE